MNKTVLVRKNKDERSALRIFSLLFLILAITSVIAIKEGRLYASLAWGIVLIPFLIFELYLETWRISFGEKICRRIFFFERTYEWRELREAKKYYSLSEKGEAVLLIFADGKSVRFRLNDQNAEKAEKIILKHCNIKHT